MALRTHRITKQFVIKYLATDGLTQSKVRSDFEWFLENATSIFNYHQIKLVEIYQDQESCSCDWYIYLHNTIEFGEPMCHCDTCQRIDCNKEEN